MHRRVLTLLTFVLALGISSLALSAAAFAEEHPEPAVPAKAKAAVLMAGYGNWHHPVSTRNARKPANAVPRLAATLPIF